VDFPADPVQFSNGLSMTLDDAGPPTTYGPDTTVDLFGSPALLGSQVELGFVIEGF
jgi:hypothetical protein